MNPFLILRKQIIKLLSTEAKLSPEERALFDWRFVIQVDKKSYIFGKTGANTMYHMVNTNEPTPMYPDQCLNLLSELGNSKFVHYKIVRKVGKFKSVAKDLIPTLDLAKKYSTSKSCKLLLYGVTADGKATLLYTHSKTLAGATWIPVKRAN